MILSVEKLCKSFGGLLANNNLDLNVQSKTIHAIIGPNGAGKTTFFNALTGLLPPDSGTITFEGKRIEYLPTHRIATMGIGRTFQNIRLFPWLSVLDNVRIGSHIHQRQNVFDALIRSSRNLREEREVREFALNLLEQVGLAGVSDTFARNLPYGEQRKLEIARAMAASPRLLLLDEPAAGMNNTETANLESFIRSLKDKGFTVLLIEHDMKLIMSIADCITVIDHGIKISEGTAKEVQKDERVIEAYLGRNK